MAQAGVVSRKGKRKGRGFSLEELKKAGFTIAAARKLKVPIDMRRKSAYDFNIAELKPLTPPEKKLKAKKAKKKAPPKPKKPAPKKKAKAPAKKPAAKPKAKPKKPAPKKK